MVILGTRTRRVLGWGLAALLGLPALLLVAWLASNWGDAPAAPRPAVLELPPPRLSEARNRHDALAGVLASPGDDPAQVARDERARMADWLALPLAERMARARQPSKAAQPPKRLAPPRGAPWACPDAQPLCADLWFDQADALARQREAAAWGPRCEALADDDLAIEELIEVPLRAGAVAAQHLTGGHVCSRWLHTGVALAFAAGDEAGLEQGLARADRFNRALIGGSRSLVATLVTARSGHALLDLVTTLALRDPGRAERLELLLANWPSQAALARRWMVYESSLSATLLDDAFDYCRSGASVVQLPIVEGAMRWSDRVTERANAFLCRHAIGMHRHRTQAYADAQWLERLAVLDAGGLAALDRFSQTPQGGSSPGGLHWRNTFGAMIVDIGTATYGEHVRRQRDLELHHRLAGLVLTIQRQGIDPGARAAWLARQPLDPEVRERLAVRDGGRTIAARAFGERSPIAGPGGEITIRWPH